MTFLRRTDQAIRMPILMNVIEPPTDFVERAYALGLDPGSGTVRLYPGAGFAKVTLDCTVSGRKIFISEIGRNEHVALDKVIAQLGGIVRGKSGEDVRRGAR